MTAETTGFPQGYETLYVHDANGNVARKDVEIVDTNPLGHYAETLYDKAGHVTEAKRWEEAGHSDVLVVCSQIVACSEVLERARLIGSQMIW